MSVRTTEDLVDKEQAFFMKEQVGKFDSNKISFYLPKSIILQRNYKIIIN